ncbi:DUF5108 domain-containing protein [Bacteroides xylanisolvens]|uniref:DUF5108 domain-containing protein n=1 Tax=Bacteroides xylanisolvens TaxID=371601 RepID=UPI0022EAE406|nr:DUF5108 domain-containing protein [Bacteroides xylanisolvens]
MKNIVKYCLLLLVICYSCDDPYKDKTFQVYNVQPAASYLETRSDEFSEWIKVLKYADLFNAINQATDIFTVFAPTNAAMSEFYARKGVVSIEELGQTYARGLAQYHIMNDTIQRDDFVAGGELPIKTLSGDVLEVSFDESGEGGFNSVYINKEAHVKEFAVLTANGLVYVLDDVLSPAIETVYERLAGHEENQIFRAAVELTGWKEELSIVSETNSSMPNSASEVRRYYTLLAVSDDVYNDCGISTVEELASRLGAGSDYTNKNNALNRYVAYHILDGNYKIAAFKSFDTEETLKKLWSTKAENALIMASNENGDYYLNFDGGDDKARFIDDKSNEQAKNGYIHQIDGYLPVCETLQPISYYFDFCDFPEVASYITSYGVNGQLYQQKAGDNEGATPLANNSSSYVSCYDMQMGPSGTISSGWGYLEYRTAHNKSEYNWWNLLHYDVLGINLGYNGTLTMNVPTILSGKYKVTLGFAYASSMNFMRLAGDVPSEGSNGGLTSFTFDDDKSVSKAIYAAVPVDELNCYKVELFGELEFASTQSHKLQLVVLDPAASTHKNFRLQLDYLLFEPIN